MAAQDNSVTRSLAELLPQVDVPAAVIGLEVTGLSIDSRLIKPGYLFVAVPGLHVHGKQFIAQAAQQGAVAVLLDASESVPNARIPVIAVAHLEKQLSAIAGRFYGEPTHAMRVVGVTGTNGKTTCTQLIAQGLSILGNRCGVLGTLGYGELDIEASAADIVETNLITTGMTTPDAVQTQKICADLLGRGCTSLAMEVSSHALVQHRVAALDIDTAVFTNLSHDHLDYHGSMAAYGNAKAQLFTLSSISKAVVNTDDDFSANLLGKVEQYVEIVTYGLQHNSPLSQAAHFSFSDIHLQGTGMQAQLHSPEGVYAINTQLIGEFNLSNLLAVIATLFAEGFALKNIVDAIPALKPVAGRMELLANPLGFQVVIDYAHTPDALKNALQALQPFAQGELWCVFGCGGDRDRQKRSHMAAMAEQYASRIVVTSDNPRSESPVQIFADIESGFSEPKEVVADRAAAIDYAISEAKPGDIVLIAGKGHEDYQQIGEHKFPFSDAHQARFSLRQREALGL